VAILGFSNADIHHTINRYKIWHRPCFADPAVPSAIL
jgi:hypothetical protein